MATGAFADITNALKNAYPSKAIEAMVNDETPFRKALKKNIPAGSRFGSGIIKFGVNLHPPENVGQTDDAGTLTTPGDRTQDQGTLKPTLFTGSFQIGWVTKAAANDSKGAFNGGELRRRTEETISNLGKFIEQTYIATDGSSKVAEVETDGSNTFVAAWPWGTRLLRVNRKISVRTTPGGDTVRDSCDYRTITHIAKSTRTVTYSGTDQTLVAGDDVSVVVGASQTGLSSIASASPGIAAFGLRGIVDDGTYARYFYGLDRQATGYNKLNSIVSSNGGVLRNLTEQILMRTNHEVMEASEKRPTDVWMSYGQAEKYVEFCAPDRRYVVNGSGTQGFGTGYKGAQDFVHYGPGISLKFNMSHDVLPREMFLLNWDTFFLYQAQDMDWWDGDMLKPLPATTTYKAAYVAHIAAIENLGNDFPLGNAVIRDLKDPICGD